MDLSAVSFGIRERNPGLGEGDRCGEGVFLVSPLGLRLRGDGLERGEVMIRSLDSGGRSDTKSDLWVSGEDWTLDADLEVDSATTRAEYDGESRSISYARDARRGTTVRVEGGEGSLLVGDVVAVSLLLFAKAGLGDLETPTSKVWASKGSEIIGDVLARARIP
jgi:hypothetical protein